MKTLSIDIKTYSDQPLNKTGVYRYVESPVFERDCSFAQTVMKQIFIKKIDKNRTGIDFYLQWITTGGLKVSPEPKIFRSPTVKCQ